MISSEYVILILYYICSHIKINIVNLIKLLKLHQIWFWCKNFKKALQSFHHSEPRVVTVDKNPAYPIAVEELRKEKKMPLGIQIRQVKYLNNIVEQDHRFIKKRVRSMLGLKSFRTASSIISGIEAMHMVKKGQFVLRDKSVQNQVKFIHQLFGITA